MSDRYIKFTFNDRDHLPPLNELMRHRSFGSVRLWASGRFSGSALLKWPLAKSNLKLEPFGSCIFCGTIPKAEDQLTSEHVIPEFLGAGIELRSASCADCQKITSKFEGKLAYQMFGPIQKRLALKGKRGLTKQSKFDIDVGLLETQKLRVNTDEHPTILTLPWLFPAAAFSRRQRGSMEILGLCFFNLSATSGSFDRMNINQFSTVVIDLASFSQMLVKIAIAAYSAVSGSLSKSESMLGFLRSDFKAEDIVSNALDHVGCIPKRSELPSEVLHEVEVGQMSWSGRRVSAVRVRLFGCYGMPSYFVTLGADPLL